MSFHTVTGLQLLAEMSNFTIEKFSYVDSHGGSFRFFLKKGYGPSKSEEIRAQIEREATLGLNSSVVLNHLQENIARRRIAVSEVFMVVSNVKHHRQKFANANNSAALKSRFQCPPIYFASFLARRS